MILTDREIIKNIKLGNIVIDPFNQVNLGANSYDLELGNELLTYGELVIDPKKDNRVSKVVIDEGGVVLRPGRLYLAKTVEWTETYNLVPMITGRSSVGRLGLFVHVTAGFGDIGFRGCWTLELVVVEHLRVYAGMKIAQIHYHSVEGKAAMEYKGKYQDSKEIGKSLMYLESIKVS